MSHISCKFGTVSVSLGRYWFAAFSTGINIGWKRPVDGTYRSAQITVRWMPLDFGERYGYRHPLITLPLTRHGVRVFIHKERL